MFFFSAALSLKSVATNLVTMVCVCVCMCSYSLYSWHSSCLLGSKRRRGHRGCGGRRGCGGYDQHISIVIGCGGELNQSDCLYVGQKGAEGAEGVEGTEGILKFEAYFEVFYPFWLHESPRTLNVHHCKALFTSKNLDLLTVIHWHISGPGLFPWCPAGHITLLHISQWNCN